LQRHEDLLAQTKNDARVGETASGILETHFLANWQLHSQPAKIHFIQSPQKKAAGECGFSSFEHNLTIPLITLWEIRTIWHQ